MPQALRGKEIRLPQGPTELRATGLDKELLAPWFDYLASHISVLKIRKGVDTTAI